MRESANRSVNRNVNEKRNIGKLRREGFRPPEYFAFMVVLVACILVCVAVGSVNIPLQETAQILWNHLTGQPQPEGTAVAIIVSTRLPRVFCVALVGAALSIGGGAMQGLLKNPLADGTTLGVSSGASLGAILSIAFGIQIPGLPFAGTAGMAMVFAFGSLMIILSLAYRLDYSLSTNTIILLGVIFTMFISSIVALITTFAAERVHSITFWLMGSFAGATYGNAIMLAVVLVICGAIILLRAQELNAFAIGEENARHIGVDVRRVKMIVMIAVSALIGVCVSVSGTIGFVGLVIPHMLRLIVGPNHKRLLPSTLFGGAIFLLLADLASRTIFSPRELPIGVVTSFVGAIVFLSIFYRARVKP
ncbi:putative ABC transporter permease protein YvrB [Clostridia bacterium]|nr:putative ABC transporter permease protein YvrB [Clostridia bacterium]